MHRTGDSFQGCDGSMAAMSRPEKSHALFAAYSHEIDALTDVAIGGEAKFFAENELQLVMLASIDIYISVYILYRSIT